MALWVNHQEMVERFCMDKLKQGELFYKTTTGQQIATGSPHIY